MKQFLYFSLVFFLFIPFIYAQDSNPGSYLIEKELNPALYQQAKESAKNLGLPLSIFFQEGIAADLLKKENGQFIYAVITNLHNPFDGLRIMNYNELTAAYDLSKAEVNYGINNEIFYNDVFSETKLLLVTDATGDNIACLNPVTGDLINNNYIPPDPVNLGTPKQARINRNGYVTVSDQVRDLVQKFDTLGAYLGPLAPAGGVNTAILDNIRGHNYRPNGNLVVTVGGGANQNSIAEFDEAGNYLGQFIPTLSGGMNSPFDIVFRSNDVLVSTSTSNAIHRFDLNGTYLNDFATSIAFAQQIALFSGGKVAVAGFSPPSGLRVYDAAGTLLNFYTALTGLRGVYELPSGNILVSNGTGVHEIEPVNGTAIRVVYASTAPHYITLADFSIIPVELAAFTASASGNSVTLNWTTATETNNSGFTVERSFSGTAFNEIAFVEGYGTTTEVHHYTFTESNLMTGKYSYRLKQIDYDGKASYSNIVNVEIGLPGNFALEQNYPNPFNPSTKIAYSVPKDAQVSIDIFNMLGEKVSTITEGFKQAGRYTVSFDASGLSSGTYMYKLTSGDVTLIRKMLLVK